MQAGKHLGKIVIVPHPDDVVTVLLKSTGTSAKLFPDASYIVVGGLGGIGRFITQMLRSFAPELADLLVDPLFTTTQATGLADWVQDLLFPANKSLTYIYITHGHGDHFFDLSTLLDRFPSAVAVATAGTIAHMEEQTSPTGRADWEAWFPGDQINFPTSPLPVRALPSDNLTLTLDTHTLHAVPAGHSDTDSTSFLWVPSLRLAVTGDIVYNGAYSYLAESLTPALRNKWVAAIDKVESYHPESVVVGHKIPGAVDGTWTLEATRKYVRLWDRLAAVATDAYDMWEKVREADPGKNGEFVLWWSCLAQFPESGGNGTVKG